MEDILDDFENEKENKGKTYSMISFANGIALWTVLFFMSAQFHVNIGSLGNVATPNLIFIYLMWGLLFSGIFFSIMSFVKKEKNSFWKIGGMILNGFILMLVIGVVVFIFS